MPQKPQDLAARARAAADDQGRLPGPPQAMWETFPFEVDGLRSVPLQDPVLPEPPRGAEGGSDCWSCAGLDADAVWSDDRWVLTGAAPLGLAVRRAAGPARTSTSATSATSTTSTPPTSAG